MIIYLFIAGNRLPTLTVLMQKRFMNGIVQIFVVQLVERSNLCLKFRQFLDSFLQSHLRHCLERKYTKIHVYNDK